jgi:hypothetical protein
MQSGPYTPFDYLLITRCILTIAGGGGGCAAARSERWRFQRVTTGCVERMASFIALEVMCKHSFSNENDRCAMPVRMKSMPTDATYLRRHEHHQHNPAEPAETRYNFGRAILAEAR